MAGDETRRLLDGRHEPHNVSFYGFLLGALVVAGLASRSFLGVYAASLAVFHEAEYLCTALYNLPRLELSYHSSEYQFAHALALVEYALEYLFFPGLKTFALASSLQCIGLAMVLVCQAIRSLAMIHAKANFSHKIVDYKHKDHSLVVDGIYAYLRHPSYFGFYWWAVGTQLMLLNPLCCVGFLLALHRFFRDRIRYEEVSLVRFFGEDYLKYQAKTPIGIPFI